jgi:hypothetical protein
MNYHERVTETITRPKMIQWNDRRLLKIVRLRLRRKHEFFEVLYCHGKMVDGEFVRVFLPFQSLNAKRWKIELVDWAKRQDVHAKNLGMFDAASVIE